MKFGPLPLAEAEGAILAHAVKREDLVLKKGAVLSAENIRRLAAAGIETIIAAKLSPDDVMEDVAAEDLARRLAGNGLRIDPPFTGRANLFAETAGVLVLDVEAIDRLNAVDEAVTVATLPAMRVVSPGEMVGTVKIIPFAVAGAVLRRALASIQAPMLRVAPFRRQRIGVVSTLLPGLKPSVIDKTLRTMERRLEPFGSIVGSERRTPHDAKALAEAIRAEAETDNDMVVVFGASAITDRRDVIPAAIEFAGGVVEHFGMPVDPGNLLLLGRISGKPVIGAPGCARSPKENGFDWVLQRLLADVPVTAADIKRMGVGGLLMEIISRPQPRAPNAPMRAPPPVAAVVLAAGRSSRMGRNKLREPVDGLPMVRHAVEAALASNASMVIVVTGHEAESVHAALTDLPVRFVHNPAYAQGLSTSLRAGLAAVPAEAAGMVVLLGDMPRVTGPLVQRLIDTFAASPDVPAVAPLRDGRRGNPVLIGRRLFPAVMRLTGDAGARRLIEQAGAAVIDITVSDESAFIDVDTPGALAALQQPA